MMTVCGCASMLKRSANIVVVEQVAAGEEVVRLWTFQTTLLLTVSQPRKHGASSIIST